MPTEEESVALVAAFAALLIGGIGELFDYLERRREPQREEHETVAMTADVVVVEAAEEA